MAFTGTLRAVFLARATLHKVIETLSNILCSANGLAALPVSARPGGISIILHPTRAKPPNLGLCGFRGLLHSLPLDWIRCKHMRELQWPATKIAKDRASGGPLVAVSALPDQRLFGRRRCRAENRLLLGLTTQIARWRGEVPSTPGRSGGLRRLYRLSQWRASGCHGSGPGTTSGRMASGWRPRARL